MQQVRIAMGQKPHFDDYTELNLLCNRAAGPNGRGWPGPLRMSLD